MANRRERGHIAGSWQALTGYNSITVGVQRISVDAGRWATPLHLEGSEEEIFYVLSGTGFSFQVEGDEERVFPVGPATASSTVRSSMPTRSAPETTSSWCSRSASGTTPPTRCSRGPACRGSARPGCCRELRRTTRGREKLPSGADAGPSSSDRPASVANLDDVPTDEHQGQPSATSRGISAGPSDSERTGLTHYVVPPGMLMNPPHVHSAEEEIFVILEGSGTLQLYPSLRSDGDELEEFPIRAGCTIARPAGTRRAHGIRAGDDGLTVLAYGTRDPNDIVHYPRSGKISFRGVGVIGRLEQVGYWDGED